MLTTKQPDFKTVAEFRAALDAAKKRAEAKFAADWGGLTHEQAMRVAVENAHLFKPRCA